MLKDYLYFISFVILLSACGQVELEPVPLAELPDPHLYTLRPDELPEVGADWHIAYDTYEEAEYKWVYVAYEAQQPPSLGGDLGMFLAINNDIVLYPNDVSRSDLPEPPETFGTVQNIHWQTIRPRRAIGDQMGLWRTSLGDLGIPAWWLGFYQGYAYVRIASFGIPDELAGGLVQDLAETVASRLPQTTEELRQDNLEWQATATAYVSPTPFLFPGEMDRATEEAAWQATREALNVPSSNATPAPPGTPVRIYFTPSSYIASPASADYPDETGVQLMDDVVGENDVTADLGEGSGYEWVGWDASEGPVTLVFTFSQPVAVEWVQLHFNHTDSLDIYLPEMVEVAGHPFFLWGMEIENGYSATLGYPGPTGGREVVDRIEIILEHRNPTGLILVSEVIFFSTSTSP